MKQGLVVRTVAGIALVLATSGLTPSPARAQTGAGVWWSPIVGVGDFRGQQRAVPAELGFGGPVALDANTLLGLQAEASLPGLPLRLRAGVARTVDGFLRVQTGYRTESCGNACTRTEVLYGSAGDAAATLFWTDVVLAPFSRRLSPYVFAGGTYRRTSFAPARPELTMYFRDVEGQRLVRYGMGVETTAWGREVWLEYARHSAEGWLVSDHSINTPTQYQQVLSMGVKFRVR